MTIARIALVPFFAVALLAADGRSVGWRLTATAIFLLAAVTDRLDGYLARRDNLVTDLGKMLDPIADKLLIGAGLIGLLVLGDLPWWVTVVILVRELGITAMRFMVLRYAVMPASRGGKLKTVLQVVAIALFLLPLDVLPRFVGVLAAVVDGRCRRRHAGDRGRLRPPGAPAAPRARHAVTPARRAVTCRSAAEQLVELLARRGADRWRSPSR